MFIDVTIQFCTCIFATALIIAFKSRKVFQKTQNYVFMGMLIIIALNSLSSAISNLIEHSVDTKGNLYGLQYSTQLILFLVHNAIGPFYAYYVMLVNGVAIHSNRKTMIGFALPFLALEILTLSNPWTNVIFYYNDSADYVRGNLIFLVYAVSAIYLIIAIIYMIKYRHLVSRETNFMLWLFFSFSLIGIVVQIISPALKIELFAECLSSLGIMLSIEEERDLIDYSTRTYNRRAFMNDNNRLIETNHHYAVITINITNIRLFVHLLSYKTMSNTVKKITSELMHIDRDTTFYRISTGNFALIYLYDDKSDVDNMIARIKEVFERGYEYEGKPLNFNVAIKCAMVPEDTSKASSLLDLTEEVTGKDISGVTVFSHEDVKEIISKGNIEAAIRKALTTNGFEIYYQPIWGVNENKYVAAEALLRLNSSELGHISPAVFIPIAEKAGLISEVGNLVFESVCKFLARKEVQELNLHCIDVNLSLYQLVVGNTLEHFKETVDKYNINPAMINLEITESAEVYGHDTIVQAINGLKSAGFKFSLDDFGTGYANISDLVAMRFDVIKSDKGLLWDAANIGAAKAILTSYIKIIRKMGVSVVQEGVETKEQLDLVVAAGANFIQGYYYSKPLPSEEFIKFVSNSNN